MVPRRWVRALALVFAAVLTCLLAPGRMAQGMERVDATRINDLTITYALDGKATPGVEVRLYRVAAVAAQDGTTEELYVLAPDFADAGVSVDTNQTDAQWAQGANALAGYVANKGLKPAASATSDKDGHVAFSGLESGLYLVVSDFVKLGADTYQILPTLCALPSLDGGAWSYSTTLVPKFQKAPHVTSYSVVKHWADDASGTTRPTSVKVAIIHDGQTQSVQTLDASNDWCYRWEADDDGSSWTVSEVDVPSGYTVSMSTSEGEGEASFVLTNSAGPSNPPRRPVPTTGDDTSWSGIALVALVGVLALGGSVALRSRKSRS